MRRLTVLRPAAAATLAALLLAGCTLAPRYEQPEPPIPAQWPHDATDQAVAATPDWRGVLLDPQLQALVEQALANNRDLRLAALNVEAARAQFRIQRADRLPGLAATAEGRRQRLPSGVAGEAGVPATGGGVVEQYSAGLGLAAFEIDLFGRVRSLSDAALAEFMATTHARRGAELSLVSAVATAWLNERAARERLALVEAALVDWEESGRLAELRFQAGVGSALEQVETATLVESARADAADARRQARQASNLLALLVGAPVDPATLPAAGPLEDAVLADLPPGLPSDLVARRPDILAAEQSLRAANASIGAARAAFFPRLSLTGFLGSASTEFSDLFESGTRTWLFQPQLAVPIFQGGRNRANLDLAHVRREASVARYELAIQEAFREVADALAAREAFHDQAQALGRLADAGIERESLVSLRFDAGVDSNLALLDARRSRYQAQQALLQARVAALSANLDLYRALGGGWNHPDPP